MRRRQVADTVRAGADRLDLATAVILSLVAVVESAATLSALRAVLGAVISLVVTTSVAWRRRRPSVAVVVAGTATVLFTAVTRHSPFVVFAIVLILVMYVAAVREFSAAAAAETLALVGYLVGAICATQAVVGELSVSAVAEIVLPIAVAPGAIGWAVARGRHLSQQLAAANVQLEAEREISIALAAMRERNRLARELHDVVAHGVSVMVVQAGAARVTLTDEPELARDLLREVASAGRAALADLQRVVGATETPEAEVDPWSHRDDALTGLVTRCRTGGIEVTIDRSGPELPGPIFDVVYRIVQEALTNVLRHARGATAAVGVRADGRVVRVSVISSAVSTPRDSSGSGRGLVGMRERVLAVGGSFTAAPTTGGGFGVVAVMPLRTSPLPRISRLRAVGMRVGPLVLGSALACGLLIDALVSSARRGALWTNLLCTAVIALVLIWRRRSPLFFVCVINAFALPLSNGLTSIDSPTLASTVVFVAPTWTVSVWSSRRAAFLGLAIEAGFIAGEGWYWHFGTSSVVSNLIVMALLWMAGRVVARQRAAAGEIVRVHEQLEAEGARLEQLRLDVEHDRLAGQLRSQVVDRVTGMIVTADTLVLTDLRSPDEIRMIEQAGRQALASLREILGLLRIDLDPNPLSIEPVAGASG